LNPEERLASIIAALEAAGLSCLVMGGLLQPVLFCGGEASWRLP